MLNIKQIQYFAACAKTGSFSQAAELLFTTQSNVSKVIGILSFLTFQIGSSENRRSIGFCDAVIKFLCIIIDIDHVIQYRVGLQ